MSRQVQRVRGSVQAYASKLGLNVQKKTLPRSKKLISRSSKARNEVARRIKFQRFKNKVTTGTARGAAPKRQKEVRSQHAKMQAATRARQGASKKPVSRKMATTVQMLKQRMKKAVRPRLKIASGVPYGPARPKNLPYVIGNIPGYKKSNSPGSKAPAGKRFSGKKDRLNKAVERAKNIASIRKNNAVAAKKKSQGVRSGRLSKIVAKAKSFIGSTNAAKDAKLIYNHLRGR